MLKLDVKEITLMDGGENKRFVIQKFRATKSYYFVGVLLNLLKNSTAFDNLVITQFVHLAIDSGVKVEGVTKDDLNDTYQQFSDNKISFMYKIFKAITTTWTQEEQYEVLNHVLPVITLINGNMPQKFSLIEGAIDNIDLYIADFKTLISLIWAVVEFNYSGFFSQSVETNS